MSYELGAIKYLVGVLTVPVGYASMYAFGGTIWGLLTNVEAIITILSNLDKPNVVSETIIAAIVPTPGGLLGSLVLYPLLGGVVAAFLWYIAVRR